MEDDWIPRWRMDLDRLRRSEHPSRKERKLIEKRRIRMGIRLSVTATDVKRSTIIAPGWTVCEIVEIKEEENKKKDAMNVVVDFVVVSPEKYSGVPLKTWITEKEAGAAMRIAFMKGLGIAVGDDGAQAEADPDNLKGRKLRVKVRTGTYNNNPQNEIEDFAPLA